MAMASDLAASIRTRAELARRLSAEIKDPAAAASLRKIAETLDAEASRLECNVTPISKPLPRVRD